MNNLTGVDIETVAFVDMFRCQPAQKHVLPGDVCFHGWKHRRLGVILVVTDGHDRDGHALVLWSNPD